MNLPKRCGNIYIKFDENNQPEYGFEVEKRGSFYTTRYYIKRFLIMTDKNIDVIVLPNLVPNTMLSSKQLKQTENYVYLYSNLDEYLNGEVKLCTDCFKNIKNAKIIVPFVGSISLDWGCFRDDANIEFITRKKMELKQVYRQFDTGFDYENENWTLLADKNLKFEGSISGDRYTVENYNKNNLIKTVANLSISHDFDSLDKEYNINN